MSESERKGWPFGGPAADGGLPEPAPEIIMAANGVYWRRYTECAVFPQGSLSMVPTSDDNDPVMTPIAVYMLVGWEDHDGTFHGRVRVEPDPTRPTRTR